MGGGADLVLRGVAGGRGALACDRAGDPDLEEGGEPRILGPGCLDFAKVTC